MNVCVVISFPL